MRTSERIGLVAAAVTAVIFAAAPAFAFEGTQPGNQDAAVPVVAAPGGIGVMKKPVPPADIPQAAAGSSLTALQYAAEGGHPIAQWKLGRMYARGDGVAQDDLRAYDYFSKIANAHAEDSPSAPQAANARCARDVAQNQLSRPQYHSRLHRLVPHCVSRDAV